MTALAMGFRPFFGLAGTLLVPAWLVALSGHGTAAMTPAWHAHELVHGFVGAVLGGFFLTAVPKWTSTTPLSGAPLAGLVLLWLGGSVVARVRGPSPGVSPLWRADAAVAGDPGLPSRAGLPRRDEGQQGPAGRRCGLTCRGPARRLAGTATPDAQPVPVSPL